MPHPHDSDRCRPRGRRGRSGVRAGLRRLGTRSHRSFRHGDRRRFLLGLATIWASLGSPLASCDAGSLTGHMVQHLLLMTIAPPLVLLGEPVRVMLSRLPRLPAGDRASLPWTDLAASGRGLLAGRIRNARAVACPRRVRAGLALVPTWHAIEQASFLLTGLLFWWPVVEPWPSGPLPSWSIVLYLFLATLPCDILSAFLVFSDRIAYAVYLSTASSAVVLADHQRAGALMWTCVTLVLPRGGAPRQREAPDVQERSGSPHDGVARDRSVDSRRSAPRGRPDHGHRIHGGGPAGCDPARGRGLVGLLGAHEAGCQSPDRDHDSRGVLPWPSAS
jgi:hypothetical protein